MIRGAETLKPPPFLKRKDTEVTPIGLNVLTKCRAGLTKQIEKEKYYVRKDKLIQVRRDIQVLIMNYNRLNGTKHFV